MRTHSPRPGATVRRLRAAFGVAASLLLAATLVTSGGADGRGDDEGPGIVQAADSTATDSLRFRAQLRAAEKPLAPIGQWAYANANGTVRERSYSTSTQTRNQSGGACAYGGSGTSCAGSASRSDASVDHRPGNWETTWGGLNPAVYVNFLANFTAGARCQSTGEVTAVPGTGIVQYGNDSHVRQNGFRQYSLDSGGNGAAFSQTFKVADNIRFVPGTRDTWIDITAVRRWAAETSDRRAWSEINVSWVARHASGGDTPGSVTYRAECGLTMNDGSGSNTRTTNFMGAAEPFEIEQRDSLTIEQDGEVTVIEIDPETGEPVGEAPATSEATTRTQVGPPADDEDRAAAETSTPTMSTTSKATSTPGTTTVSSPKPTRTSSTRTPSTSPTSEASAGPQVGGFEVEAELERESQTYQLLATRELAATEFGTVRDALDEAAEGEATRGTVDGGAWTVFSGDGRSRPVPVVEIRLEDGSVVQLRPIVDGADLPAPDSPTSEASPTAVATATRQEAGR